jgi:hypothetical protein
VLLHESFGDRNAKSRTLTYSFRGRARLMKFVEDSGGLPGNSHSRIQYRNYDPASIHGGIESNPVIYPSPNKRTLSGQPVGDLSKGRIDQC